MCMAGGSTDASLEIHAQVCMASVVHASFRRQMPVGGLGRGTAVSSSSKGVCGGGVNGLDCECGS